MQAQTALPSITDALPTWTPELVCERMIAAFRKLPGSAVYSSRGRVYAVGELPPGPTKVINWAFRYLHHEHRRALLVWASAKARGDSEHSMRQIARDHGWDWTTFQRRRKNACAKIAKDLTRDNIPVF